MATKKPTVSTWTKCVVGGTLAVTFVVALQATQEVMKASNTFQKKCRADVRASAALERSALAQEEYLPKILASLQELSKKPEPKKHKKTMHLPGIPNITHDEGLFMMEGSIRP